MKCWPEHCQISLLANAWQATQLQENSRKSKNSYTKMYQEIVFCKHTFYTFLDFGAEI
jgi:hypothetical protein